jgi:hypothetical protein
MGWGDDTIVGGVGDLGDLEKSKPLRCQRRLQVIANPPADG